MAKIKLSYTLDTIPQDVKQNICDKYIDRLVRVMLEEYQKEIQSKSNFNGSEN